MIAHGEWKDNGLGHIFSKLEEWDVSEFLWLSSFGLYLRGKRKLKDS